MKSKLKVNSELELSELLKRYSTEKFFTKSKFNFIIYSLDNPDEYKEGKLINGSVVDRTQGLQPKILNEAHYKLFKKNYEDSIKYNFLSHCIYLIDLSITTFEHSLSLKEFGEEETRQINRGLDKLSRMKEEFNRLVSFDRPLVDSEPSLDHPINLYFSYNIAEDQTQREPATFGAILEFLTQIYLPYGSVIPNKDDPRDASTNESSTPNTKQKLSKGNDIFANYKDIDISKQFGIPKSLSDGLSRVIKYANPENAANQYRESNRGLSFKAGKAKAATTLSIDESALSHKAADEFAKQLMKVKDAKILQTFCSFWKFACIQNSFQFREVPLSAVMEIALKKNDKTNFSVENRRNFTSAIEHLLRLTITLQSQKEVVDKRGKVKTVLEVEKGVRLMRAKLTYALKKEYQNLPKEDLDNDVHFDKTVISKFSGELLPDYNQGFTGRSSIYYDALLRMDANKDRKAIVLGFSLQTRFNQNQDKDKPLQYERSYLIELCDYQKTEQTKPSEATKQIHKVLTKLKENDLIGGFDNLTNNNTDKVNIFPPTSMKIQSQRSIS